MKMRLLALPLAATLAFSVTGCQNVVQPSKTTTAFYDNQVSATLKISDSVNTVAKAIAPDSAEVQKRVEAIEAENKRLREDIARTRSEADRMNEDLKRKVGDVALDVGKVVVEAGKVASAVAGAGPLAGTITEFIGGVVKDKVSQAKRETAEDTNQAIAKAKEALRAELSQSIKLTEAQQVQFKEEIARLGREKGLSPAEIAKLQETDLSTLLVTGGSAGSLALLALLRTLGGSRAEPKIKELAVATDSQAKKIEASAGELDELWEQVKALEAKLAVTEKDLDRCARGAVKGDVSECSATVADLSRRLGRLESRDSAA